MLAILGAVLTTFAASSVSACGFPGCENAKTPGYWKNHPEAWPVDVVTIGGVPYTKEAAIEIIMTSGSGDKTYTMFRALVAAMLNLENGCDDCIEDVVEDADEWMTDNPLGSDVKGSSEAWQDGGEMLYTWLDLYNNGEACPT